MLKRSFENSRLANRLDNSELNVGASPVFFSIDLQDYANDYTFLIPNSLIQDRMDDYDVSGSSFNQAHSRDSDILGSEFMGSECHMSQVTSNWSR